MSILCWAVHVLKTTNLEIRDSECNLILSTIQTSHPHSYYGTRSEAEAALASIEKELEAANKELDYSDDGKVTHQLDPDAPIVAVRAGQKPWDFHNTLVNQRWEDNAMWASNELDSIEPGFTLDYPEEKS